MKLMTEEKKGFKRTELGLIPEDWQVRPIIELTDVATGNTPKTSDRSNYGGEYLFVSPADLSSEAYIYNTEKKLSHKGFSKSRKFPKNSTLFTCIGSTIGKTGLASEELTSNQQINAVFPSENLHHLYSYYILTFRAPSIKELAGNQAVPIINKTQFQNTKIPLPPTLEEQQAIASALSDVDELIRSLDGLIQKKQSIKKGTMQQLLTGKKRLPGFDGEWEVEKLGEIGITINGLSGKTKADFGDGNHPYITFMNIMSNTVIDTSIFDTVKVRRGESQSEIKKGDLLFNTSSETPEEVGMCSVLLEDVENLHLNSFCFGYRIHEQDEVLPLFLAYYFRSEFGRKHMQALAQGSTRYNLSKSKFVKIEMELPEFEEQKAIAQILSDMDRELQTLRQKRKKFVQIKQGMMQELLTGRVRLV